MTSQAGDQAEHLAAVQGVEELRSNLRPALSA